MAEAEQEFSPSGYAALLDGFASRGYIATGFAKSSPDSRHLILRHDIDFSLDAAAAMAELEHQRGVRATYFVLLRTEFYNPLSGAGLATLRQIAAHGHTIGLHFDAALYDGGRAAIDAAALREADLLARMLGSAVDVVSHHRPGPLGAGQPEHLGGRLNAYGPRFVRMIGYCSDSRGAWRHGHPLAHEAVKNGRALQLLVHPIWWQAPAMPPAQRLREFLLQRAAFLDREAARHCTIYEAGK